MKQQEFQMRLKKILKKNTLLINIAILVRAIFQTREFEERFYQ